MTRLRWAARTSGAILRRPSLWATAVAQLFSLARPRWWRRAPFLPVPDAAYLRFRMMTVYGGDGSALGPSEDVVDFLSWCRTWPGLVDRPASTPGHVPTD